MGFFDYFNNDLAIDLGTANTLIISKGSVVVDLTASIKSFSALSHNEDSPMYFEESFSSLNDICTL